MLRLQCPNCTTRFLNIAPDKLLLGTSVLLPLRQLQQRQQQQPEGSRMQPAAAQTEPGATSSNGGAAASAGAAAKGGHQHAGAAAAAAADTGAPAAIVAAGPTHVAHDLTLDDIHEDFTDDDVDGDEDDADINDDDLIATAAVGASGTVDPKALVVDELAVLEVAARAAGLPLAAVLRDQRGAPVSHLRAALEAAVVGQREAVRAVCTAVQLHRLGLAATAAAAAGAGAAAAGGEGWQKWRGQQQRPVASFLLEGPPGVGKSTLCKVRGRGRGCGFGRGLKYGCSRAVLLGC